MPKSRKNNGVSLLKGLLIAILITLVGMVLVAAAVTWLHVPDKRIRFLNQLVKYTAIILGTCASVRKGGEMGLATGTFLALAYMALGYGMYMGLGGQRRGRRYRRRAGESESLTQKNVNLAAEKRRFLYIKNSAITK